MTGIMVSKPIRIIRGKEEINGQGNPSNEVVNPWEQ